MANSCTTDHIVNLIITLFLCSEYECRKIRAIRAIYYIPKIHVSPQSSLKPPVLAITQNSPTIFRFGPREMETSSFTANCAKFAQIANHHGESREIRTILTNFYHSLFFKCTPTFYSKTHKICPIRKSLERITRN